MSVVAPLAQTKRRAASALTRLALLLTGSPEDEARLSAASYMLTGPYLATAVAGVTSALTLAWLIEPRHRVLLTCLVALSLIGAAVWRAALHRRSASLTAVACLGAIAGWPAVTFALTATSGGRNEYAIGPVAVVSTIVALSASRVLRPMAAIIWVTGLVALIATGSLLAGTPVPQVAFVVVSAVVAGSLGLVERRVVDQLLMTRNELARLMSKLAVRESLEETAQAVVDELLSGGDFEIALLSVFLPDGTVRHMAHASRLAGRLPCDSGHTLGTMRSAYLRARVSGGPWISDWVLAAETTAFESRMYAAGLRSTLHAPVTHHGTIIGVIAVGYGERAGETAQSRRALLRHWQPAVAEAASLVGSLLATQVAALDDREEEIRRLRAVIDGRMFTPVFQPIVALATGTVVGYEALTRFADGGRPDRVFEVAARVGLGEELEAATLALAIKASATLRPRSAYLSTNLSPGFLQSERARRLLSALRRPLTIELTEHMPIEDYAAVRSAARSLGPGIRLAVDDAGAGFASLRHVLELSPDIVKLDVALVRSIDADPARQALVAGMVHFAERGFFDLVAEGVETEAERATLAALDVSHGQGYLFGQATRAGRSVEPGTAVA
jgi:EAL domain-containing protein (putative c-di-GMP-specific phosphodiesterase class I)